ncbi:MAG: hypothetical protein H7X92_14260 [Chitinophagales bacterium]|nr:hypothetical protein [Hyphomicrobiales bacterium]
MLPRYSALVSILAAVCAFGAFSANAQAPVTAPPVVKKTVKPGKRCKTLIGEMVTFGEQTTRESAVEKLDEAIAAFRAKPGNEQAIEKDRTLDCKVYIKWLNEYECTATATVCK